MAFPFYKQFDTMDCGPACLRMIARYYGKTFSLQILRDKCSINRDGVSLLGISEAATQIGFRTISIKAGLDALSRERALPCIAHWRQNHFIVIYKINAQYVWVADPAKAIIKYRKKDFMAGWGNEVRDGEVRGIILLIEPTARFYSDNEEGDDSRSLSFRHVGSYFIRYRKLFTQLMLGLIVGNLLQLFFPFFTQAIVDVGIATRDVQLIYLLLVGQLMLFIGNTMVDFMRSWIMLHISTRINMSLLSDFLMKLMRLPLSYFDIKMLGDIMQRMGDHGRIESFLTGNAIGTFFSLFNFFVFTFIIISYDFKLFLIFATGSTLYFLWIYGFLKMRRALNFKQFDISAKNQSVTIQLINGMQEIKMNDCEQQKRWEWERIQTKLFKLNVKLLSLGQFQQGGAFFINQTKNILITFFSARAVVNGQLTLGGMMAIQYIIGQLNAPVQQFIQFMQSYQDARISLERINEIHSTADEEPFNVSLLKQLPKNKSIVINNMCYKYPGYENEWVLNNVSMHIPHGKTTAIVGVSGSGKTTLVKMLLRFYNPVKGDIKVDSIPFSNFSHRFWRSRCGTVMQDGFIFSDTIANNITLKDEYPDLRKLNHAIEVANIEDFISTLPMGYNTKIGAEGNGISQGQRQRILIARAVYKDPDYIFFDEATNSLDANNERVIMRNLETFCKGRTVVIVAHRLSTVKHADQIIVLNKGRITECGTHEELIYKQGDYFELVKNQLEIAV